MAVEKRRHKITVEQLRVESVICSFAKQKGTLLKILNRYLAGNKALRLKIMGIGCTFGEAVDDEENNEAPVDEVR